ncbi:unnamed protein product [Caenorhabditis sp. 36 PRJEB53466]|nr:unnamed protein product [Caenorhabditis sp. 36 PRJEB53466]
MTTVTSNVQQRIDSIDSLSDDTEYDVSITESEPSDSDVDVDLESGPEEINSEDEGDEEVFAVVSQIEKIFRVKKFHMDKAEGLFSRRFAGRMNMTRPMNAIRVFRFDCYCESVSLWPTGTPPYVSPDWTHFVREEELVKQGQPQRILEPPILSHYLESPEFKNGPHPKAAWYPEDYSAGMVAYCLDPYFYVNVCVPPPADLLIPPLPKGFIEKCRGLLGSFVWPEPADQIIPILYHREGLDSLLYSDMNIREFTRHNGDMCCYWQSREKDR